MDEPQACPCTAHFSTDGPELVEILAELLAQRGEDDLCPRQK